MSEPAKGTTPYRNNAVSSTKVAALTIPARIFYVHFYNPNASGVWLQFFDLASASVTVGTTTPTRELFLPATGGVDGPLSMPWGFDTAVTIAATTTSGGSSAPASAIHVQMEYRGH